MKRCRMKWMLRSKSNTELGHTADKNGISHPEHLNTPWQHLSCYTLAFTVPTPAWTPGTGHHVLFNFANPLHLAKALVCSRWSQAFAKWTKWFTNKDVCSLGKEIGWKARKGRRELTFIKWPYVSEGESGILLL